MFENERERENLFVCFLEIDKREKKRGDPLSLMRRNKIDTSKGSPLPTTLSSGLIVCTYVCVCVFVFLFSFFYLAKFSGWWLCC